MRRSLVGIEVDSLLWMPGLIEEADGSIIARIASLHHDLAREISDGSIQLLGREGLLLRHRG